jgi:hypothetical protein
MSRGTLKFEPIENTGYRISTDAGWLVTDKILSLQECIALKNAWMEHSTHGRLLAWLAEVSTPEHGVIV